MPRSKPTLIDVREPAEFGQSHAPDALNIPLEQILSTQVPLENIPFDTELIVYCRSGARADVALQHLRQLGYSDVINGINADFVQQNHL